jgi:hypothetical protein
MPWGKRNIRRTPDANTPIVPLVRTRIIIPQPITRPIDIHARDLIRKEYVKIDPWWSTMHRRGLKRPKVGNDPQEARAVPRSVVKGTLPERILYNGLVSMIHLVAGIDFTFQTVVEWNWVGLWLTSCSHT